MNVIFISYSWIDSFFARSIAKQLSMQGYQVWIDYQNLDLDEPLVPQLTFAIRAADLFLVIGSPYSNSSQWVQLEIFLAQIWHKSIHIIYAPLDAC